MVAPARALVVVGVLLAATACSTEGRRACTTVGGIDALSVLLAPSARTGVERLHVELCQGEVCGDVTFAATPPDRRSAYIRPGVFREGAGRYRVDLAALGRRWDPDARARVEVTGLSARSAVVVRDAEEFAFTRTYPNGEDCDERPFLSHRVRVS